MNKILNFTFLFLFSCQLSFASNSFLVEEQTSSRESMFKELHQHLEKHLNHLEDTVAVSLMLRDSNANEALEIETAQCVQVLKQNIKHISEMAGFLRDVHEGKMEMKLFMKTLLDFRLRNLQKRKTNLLRAKKDLDGITYYLTSPEIIESIPETLRIFPETTIDTYQTINRLIIGLLSLEDLKTLPASTKKMLRASPSLWNRIQGLDDDLGFPDEALLDLDSINLDHPIQSAEFQKFGDLYYHDTYIIERTPVQLYQYSSFYKSPYPVTQFVSLYDASLFSGEKEGLEALPYPDFLKPYPRVVVDILETVKKESLQKSVKVRSKGKKRTKPLPLSPSLTELEEEKETVDTLVEIMPVFPLISSNNESIEEVSKKDETRSQGAFSSSLKIEPINLSIDTKPMIKGRPLKTLEDIFDAKAFSNTTFAKFQILWEKIGGTLKGTKSGGSHRSILLNGKVIGGTFVPHGGHGYGKRCIKELRDVLTIAGYGSDYLDD